MGGPKLLPAKDVMTCAFCGGKGTDPFNVMSSQSVCAACGGHGTLEVPVPHERCAFCLGTGSHKTFRCPVCGGAGVVAALKGPTCHCPDCGGTAFEASSGLPCLACHGRGVVKRQHTGSHKSSRRKNGRKAI
jgi:DnaJ-class molecular chaperone